MDNRGRSGSNPNVKLDKQVSIAALTTPDYASPFDETSEESKKTDYFQFWDYIAPNIIIEEYRQQVHFNKM